MNRDLPVLGPAPAAPPRPAADPRTRRALRAVLILASAVALAVLWKAWHVPRGLAALGCGLLLAMALPTMFLRAVPGALSRPWAILFAAAAAGVVLGLLGVEVGERPGPSGAVIVEAFVPPGATESGRWRDLVPRMRAPEIPRLVAEGRVVPVVHDLRDASARARLGRLSGRDAALAEDEARLVGEAVVFVNGEPASALEPIGAAIARELARDGTSQPIASRLSERGEVSVEFPADPPVRPLLLLVGPLDPDAGLEPVWSAVRDVLAPIAEGPSAGASGGTRATGSGGQRREARFAMPGVRADISARVIVLESRRIEGLKALDPIPASRP